VIRVAVAGKSAIVRSGLEAIVLSDSELQLVRAASLEMARDADVVLLDAPEGNSLPVASARVLAEPLPPVVALVAEVRRVAIQRLLATGGRGILLREAPPHEILAAIHAVAAGLAVVSPEVLDALVPSALDGAPADEAPASEPLTERETQVLAALAEGAGNKEIATRLRISEHTMKFHVSSILAKLGAATRTEAVARGYREGLIVI